MERIKQGKSGLLRKRIALELELPANVKDQTASRWVFQTFADILFSELAGAFQLSEKELIEACAKDEALLLGLALIATNERRLDLFESVVAHLSNAWERMFDAGLETLGAMTEPERQSWEEIIVHPYRKDLPMIYALWDWLHRITDSAAAPSVMSLVLHAKSLEKVLKPEHGAAPWLGVIAALCPAAQRRELREQFVDFDQSLTVGSLPLLDILDGMENDHTHV